MVTVLSCGGSAQGLSFSLVSGMAAAHARPDAPEVLPGCSQPALFLPGATGRVRSVTRAGWTSSGTHSRASAGVQILEVELRRASPPWGVVSSIDPTGSLE